MAQPTGSLNKSRFYIDNVDKGFKIPFQGFKEERETDKLVDRLSVDTDRNDDIEYGDEVAVYDQQGGSDTKIFGGYINLKEKTNNFYKIEADEFITEAVDAKVKKVFKDESPEAILDDLITNETSLSFFAPVSSNVVLDKYIVEGKIEEAIEDMTKILDWQVRTTPNREFYFEPRGRINSGTLLTHGENCTVSSTKQKDSKFVNTVELRGGRASYKRTQSFTGDGSSTTFGLNEVPTGNVEVTVDGNRQEGGIAEDLQDGDDYFIEQDTQELVFDTAPSNGANIEIDYSYEIPIIVEAEAPNAKVDPSKREISTTIKREWIKTFEDARDYARNYVRNRARLIGEIELTTDLDIAPPIGHLAKVVDDSKGIDGKFVVKQKTINSQGRVDMTLGAQSYNAIDWRRKVQKRIEEVLRDKTTNKVLTKYKNFDNSVDANVSLTISVKKREVNDSFILGNSNKAVLGEDRLGDRRGPKEEVLTTS